MKINRKTLHQLIESKLCQAGLKCEHAATVAEVLVYTDTRGIHSHGTVHVEYYAERISKGGTNHELEFRLEKTGPCSTILHVDNAAGQVAVKMDTEHVIKTTQQNNVAMVGISRMSRSGTTSYFVQQAARAGLIDISMCQSDPMMVPFGDAEIYYGIDPLTFATPGEGNEILTFDMATTVQAQGKVLDAHSRNTSTSDTWAADKNGTPTTNPFAVHALLPTAGPKGYGLMMMIDVLSGVLPGLPFGRQVNSTYDDLHAGRSLRQLHVVTNPDFLSSSELFRQHLSQTMHELSATIPAPGFNQVCYPGQDQDIKQRKAAVEGIEIVDDIHQYLISDALYNTPYETKDPFAQQLSRRDFPIIAHFRQAIEETLL